MSWPSKSLWVFSAVLAYLAVVTTFGFWGEVLLFPPEMSYARTLNMDELLDEMSPTELGEPIAPLQELALQMIHTSAHDDCSPGTRDPFLNVRESRIAAGEALAVKPAQVPRENAWPKLTAVILVGAEYAAILDTGVARAGETVAGVEVLRIEDQTVWIRRAGERRVLSLAQGRMP